MRALRPGWLLRETAARRGPAALLPYEPQVDRRLAFVYVHADVGAGR